MSNPRDPRTGAARRPSVLMVGSKGVPARAGGVERVLEEVGARIVQRGWRVIVVARRNYTQSRAREHRGMELVYAPFHLKRKGLDSLSASATGLFRALLRERPDVLHLHGLGVFPLAAIGRVLGIRTVVTTHGMEWRNAQWSGGMRRLFRGAERLGCRWADRLSSVGSPDAIGLAERSGREVTALPNGVDPPSDAELAALRAPDSSRPIPSDGAADRSLVPGRYLLFVGRLMPEKGPQYLVRAWETLVAANRVAPDMQLAIVGDAPGRPDFLADLRRVPQASRGRVHWLGFRYGAELARLYAHASAVVIPSESEAQALVLLEAMAYGVPVIASDIPSNMAVLRPEGVASRDLAMPFPALDAEALAAAIESLLRDPAAARSTAARAQSHVRDRYSWDAVAERYLALYADPV